MGHQNIVPIVRKTFAQRYGLAVLLTMIALGVTLLLQSTTAYSLYMPFVGAVAISAWYGGLNAGIFATLLSIVMMHYFIIDILNMQRNGFVDFVVLIIFLSLAIFISWLEETRIRSGKRAKEIANQLNMVLSGISDAVTAQDITGKVIFSNEAAAKLLKFSSAEIFKNTPVYDVRKTFAIYDENDNIVTLPNLPSMKAIITGITSEKIFRMHFLQTNENKWVSMRSTPVFNDKGDAYLAINVFRDVTEEREKAIQNQELRDIAIALREASNYLTGTLELEEVLNRVVTYSTKIVKHDAANLMLVDNNRVRVARMKGYTVHGEDYWSMPIVDALPLRRMAQTFKPIIQNDIQTDTYWQDLPERARGMKSYMGAVISLHSRVIAFLNVFSEKENAFSQKDADNLQSFANQSAIAIQNAVVYQQAKEIASLEERQRLARDLHDSVSQTLFTSNVMAESALRQWERNPTKSHHLMEQVHHLTGSALAEMRILLLELRPKTLEQVPLNELLRLFVVSMRSRQPIPIELKVDEIPLLPMDVKIAFYRILQESLNNIIKHANAKSIVVELILENNQIQLCIEDDGTGFKVDAVGATSLGLGIMQERAEDVKATFTITSNEGKGTKVCTGWKLIDIPVETEREPDHER